MHGNSSSSPNTTAMSCSRQRSKNLSSRKLSWRGSIAWRSGIPSSLRGSSLKKSAMDIRNIVILTGAGVSAESGLATFRGPDGLWEGHRVEDVATPEAFRRDPALVHKFYDERRAKLAKVQPNEAHKALARLDEQW